MSFDYPHTCPKIDAALKDVKRQLEGFSEEVVDAFLSQGRARFDFEDWDTDLFDRVKDLFEAVRETNSDMRAEAEKQIEELENQLQDLQ